MKEQTAFAIAIVGLLWLLAFGLFRRFQRVGTYYIPAEEQQKLQDLITPPKPAKPISGVIVYAAAIIVAASLMLASPQWRGLVCFAWMGAPPALLILWFLVATIRQANDRDQIRIVELINAGDPAEALRDAQQALELHGPSASRLNALGVVLSSLKRWDEACTNFREAVRQEPKELAYRANFALSLWKTGATAEAIELMPEVIAAYPLDPGQRSQYCQMLADAGRIAEARTELGRVERLMDATRFESDKIREELEREVALCREKIERAELT